MRNAQMQDLHESAPDFVVRTFEVGDLFEPPKPMESPALDPKMVALPLGEIPWEHFQKLCARLVCREYEGNPSWAFEYGRSGQEQAGIDIIWWCPGSARLRVAQVKRVNKIRRGDILRWVNEFRRRRLHSQTEDFLLCIACGIEHDTRLIDEWQKAENTLFDDGIRAEVWHGDRINDFLRRHGDLVSIFFSSAYRSRFCSQPQMPEGYPSLYRKEYEHKINEYSVLLENQTIRFDVILPHKRIPRLSALVSFSRADLSGISFVLPGEVLASWLQWIAHNVEPRTRPYITRYPGDTRSVLLAPDVRLCFLQKKWSSWIGRLDDAGSISSMLVKSLRRSGDL